MVGTRIRPAERRDVPALVRLRLANAERHVQLDPVVFRLPDAAAVQRHFEEVVGSALISVAEVEGEVVGMLLPEPHGVSVMFAGIFATNEDAVAFYSAAGFGPRGTLLSKPCG